MPAASQRFLTEDTCRGEADDFDTWHLYAYCANNPVNYTDPSGHVAQAVAIKLAVKGLAGIFGTLAGTSIAPVLGGVLIATAFTYVTVKVKQKLQEELPSVVMGLSVRAAKIAIDASTVEAKRLAKPRSKGPYHKHHIVAKAAKRSIYAIKSREILKSVNIGINSSYNIVKVYQNVHALMHTNAYYKGVHDYIARKPMGRSIIIQRLYKLKLAIKSLDKAINGI